MHAEGTIKSITIVRKQLQLPRITLLSSDLDTSTLYRNDDI